MTSDEHDPYSCPHYYCALCREYWNDVNADRHIDTRRDNRAELERTGL